jgi:hypothetical protein
MLRHRVSGLLLSLREADRTWVFASHVGLVDLIGRVALGLYSRGKMFEYQLGISYLDTKGHFLGSIGWY